ncbi:MAG: hypothetical protein KKF95_07675, partial [Nanoarchaeota archaeon]|nr:hypothetical protein [Nanoarchaeota archaeon]
MNEETSVPTWFASVLLIISSVLLWIIGTSQALAKNNFAKYWKVLAVTFLVLSIDEGSSIHEVLSDPLRAVLGIKEGIFYYAWVIPGLLLLAVLAFWFFKFWQNLYSSTRWLVFWAGLL